MRSSSLAVGGYLVAIVAANLSLAHWGPRAAVYNAFLFIGFDLIARDRLHDSWRGRGLVPRMAALIAAGGILSYLLALWLTPDELDVARIAAASTFAFTAAAVADALAYHILRDRVWYERANQSNLVSSAVDSVLFLPLAFGGFPWGAIFSLFCAKVAGGVVWSFAFRGRDGRTWWRSRERFAET
jgi:queuosine precursor transporter